MGSYAGEFLIKFRPLRAQLYTFLNDSEKYWCLLDMFVFNRNHGVGHGLSVDFPWIVHGMSMDKNVQRKIHGLSLELSMDWPWTVHRLSMNCPARGRLQIAAGYVLVTRGYVRERTAAVHCELPAAIRGEAP